MFLDRTSRRRSAAMLFAGAFAVCFGGVGAFASWAVGATLWDAWRANGWARVPAEVLQSGGGAVQYRYQLGGHTFVGGRLGVAAIGAGESAAAGRIRQAIDGGAPLEVLVDPDDPSQSVADNTVPWTMMIGLLPLALGFGAVGLVAAGTMVAMARHGRGGGAEAGVGSGAASGVPGLTYFAVLWSAVALPLAGVMAFELGKHGDWPSLLVLFLSWPGCL